MSHFPRLRADARWAAADDGSCLLSDPSGTAALRMGELEHLLLSHLDGDTPVTEVLSCLRLLSGRPISAASVQRLLEGLAARGLLELPAPPALHTAPHGQVRCLGCGSCCHLSVGPLSRLDAERILLLPWAEVGYDAPPPDIFQEVEGALFLSQEHEDAACPFLEDDDRCRIQRLFGHAAKPLVCRLYPLQATAVAGEGLRVGASHECPGVCHAGPGSRPLAEEAARHVEALIGLALPGTDLSLCPGVGPEIDEGALACELEEELLRLLGSAGSVEEALAQGARRVLAQAGGALPAGAALVDLVQELTQLTAELEAGFSRRCYQRRLATFSHSLRDLAEALTRPTPRPARPLPPEQEDLLRRAWTSLLFTRLHLLRHGLVAGLTLLGLLQLLFRRGLTTAGEAEPTTAASPEDLLSGIVAGLRVLEPVEALPGVGARCLRELIPLLDGEGRAEP